MSDDQRPTADEPRPDDGRPHLSTGLESQIGDDQLDTSVDDTDVVPFEGLVVPAPLPSSPPASARWLAFFGILVGGLLGGLIGFGTTDLLTDSSTWAALGGLVGAVGGAVGVGIVSALTLRAMNEWREVNHPEASS